MLLIKRIKKDKNCEKYIIQKGYGFRKGKSYEKEKKMFFSVSSQNKLTIREEIDKLKRKENPQNNVE